MINLLQVTPHSNHYEGVLLPIFVIPLKGGVKEPSRITCSTNDNIESTFLR